MSSKEAKTKGPRVAELELMATRADSFKTSIEVEFAHDKPIPINADRHFVLTLHQAVNPRLSTIRTLRELKHGDEYIYWGHIGDGMRDIAEICGAGLPFKERGSLRYESVNVKCTNPPIPSKDLKLLALQAWCEAFGLEEPDMEALKARSAARKAEGMLKRDEYLKILKSAGVDEWQKIALAELSLGDYKKSDLQGTNLHKLVVDGLDFRGSNFDNARLDEADFLKTDLRDASFRNANLKHAKFHRGTQLNGVDFTDANLSGATLEGNYSGCKFDNANLENAFMRSGSSMSKTSFTDANLKGAKFSWCDLKGADLTQCNLTDAEFNGCSYNAETKWPSTFLKVNGLDFRGTGSDPLLVASLKVDALEGPVDFDAFIEQLNKKFDADRLKKSLKMLKSEKFQLFSQVNDDSVVGIVKSQTDADLVYSCRLTSAGNFSCCTQNLNTCGGLRGALCKHLLVLLIGLAKSKELDPTNTYHWVLESLARKPELDRDAASEVFLRYKGAEAGDLDWRPTETIPEDYYAY